jgi:hypothetical protein
MLTYLDEAHFYMKCGIKKNNFDTGSQLFRLFLCGGESSSEINDVVYIVQF